MEIEQAIQQMLIKIDNMQTDVNGIKADVGVLKTDVGTLKADVGVLKTDVSVLKTDVGTLKTDVTGLKASNEVIMAQTAQLTEFRTEINEKLNQVIDEMEFLKSKEYQNEKDLYKLKQVVRLASL